MRKTIVFICLFSAVIFVNLFFRSYPGFLPQLDSQAKISIEQEIQKKAAEQVKNNFPDLDFPSQVELSRILARDNKVQNKAQIEKRIKEEAAKLKAKFQDESGQTYLLEMDPAHWARYVGNVISLGHPGDIVKNGRQMDMLMLAPFGMPLRWSNFLYYFSASLYKGFVLIHPVSLNAFLFYLPLFFMSLLLTVLYLFCYRRWGNLAAIIACIFVGTTPGLIYRSSAGWFDTDILNLLLPFCIVWAYLNAVCAKTSKLRIFWIFVSGFLVGLFSYVWIGWWFILGVICVYYVFDLLNSFFVLFQYKQKDSQLLQRFILFLSFLLLSFVFIILLSGTGPLEYLSQQVHDYVFFGRGLTDSIWPNGFFIVDELRPADLSSLIVYLGGHLKFIIAVLAIFIIYLQSARNPKYSKFERETIVILVMWFLLLLFASLKGLRFLIFLTLPMGICLGWGAGLVYRWLRNYKNTVFIWIFLCIVAVFCVQGTIKLDRIARMISPTINTPYYKILLKIKESTPKTAIINSWWDFGDWYKFVAGRRVIFDGQSQQLPQTYWMAKALITGNEKESLAILRMLNNGGNKAYEIIQKYTKDPYESIFLLKEILLQDRQSALNKLLTFLPKEAADSVAGLIFDTPPKAYFIVDYHMQVRLLPISLIGNWDFGRAYLARDKSKNKIGADIEYLVKFGYDRDKLKKYETELKLISADAVNSWVSRPFEFRSKILTGKEKDGFIFFDGGVVYDPKNEKIYQYLSGEGNSQIRIPKKLFIGTDDAIKEVAYADNNVDYSILVFNSDNRYNAICLDSPLAHSIFTRLYFLGGKGLKHFKPFVQDKIDNGYIRVFEIIWD